MSYVSIYLPAMKLKRIKQYAQEKDISVSRLFVRGVLAIVNSQPTPKCDFCHNTSIGKFKIIAYSLEQGETQAEKYLCDFHLKKAQA